MVGPSQGDTMVGVRNTVRIRVRVWVWVILASSQFSIRLGSRVGFRARVKVADA